jgi:myosin heavy subunit
MQKNKDALNEDVVKAMLTSSNSFVTTLFRDDLLLFGEGGTPVPPRPQVTRAFTQKQVGRIPVSQTTPRTAGNKVTVCKKFEIDLQLLIDTLDKSERHSIRCIKPNDTSSPGTWDIQKVVNQLRTNGIVETIKLRAAGYGQRSDFETFISRYSILHQEDDSKNGGKLSKESIKHFLEVHLSESKENFDWAVGKTRVFLKDFASDQLERARFVFLVSNLPLPSTVLGLLSNNPTNFDFVENNIMIEL